MKTMTKIVAAALTGAILSLSASAAFADGRGYDRGWDGRHYDRHGHHRHNHHHAITGGNRTSSMRPLATTPRRRCITAHLRRSINRTITCRVRHRH